MGCFLSLTEKGITGKGLRGCNLTLSSPFKLPLSGSTPQIRGKYREGNRARSKYHLVPRSLGPSWEATSASQERGWNCKPSCLFIYLWVAAEWTQVETCFVILKCLRDLWRYLYSSRRRRQAKSFVGGGKGGVAVSERHKTRLRSRWWPSWRVWMKLFHWSQKINAI